MEEFSEDFSIDFLELIMEEFLLEFVEILLDCGRMYGKTSERFPVISDVSQEELPEELSKKFS